MGPVRNAAKLMESNGAQGTGGGANLWPDILAHPNYDQFWQSRDIRRHLNHVRCAVLSVGGWYDAEDPLGPLATFREATARNPSNDGITLCMGPWAHGQVSEE
jgi:uncharacterized protein